MPVTQSNVLFENPENIEIKKATKSIKIRNILPSIGNEIITYYISRQIYTIHR